jgi:hypothetical protein
VNSSGSLAEATQRQEARVMAAKRPAKTKATHTWEITLIRQRGQFLGFVDAPDERAATCVIW